MTDCIFEWILYYIRQTLRIFLAKKRSMMYVGPISVKWSALLKLMRRVEQGSSEFGDDCVLKLESTTAAEDTDGLHNVLRLGSLESGW